MTNQVRTIGQVAQLLGISVETIRFYERKGLIEKPKKPEFGYRIYSPSTIQQIRFIKASQANGFSLSEIETLMTLDKHECSTVAKIATDKLRNVQEKITQMKQIEKALKSIICQCAQANDNDDCQYIHHFLSDSKTTD